ncbi:MULTISPECIES: TetR/AcrR family transcriptional regulator [unclassified Roseateles]|uniref:TetR/AcrR family transcriptional regulator n=1 Tax=unclassified Roseateles TaxID=2626991 RepID=UPI0006F93CC2|nr:MULTISPECIES: TetR/AcrR family transcriptional regulator [unclassified Roseateles]KQW49544.1 TetR family transcriptional regulator [Pelomonas sp. Root405]KRA75602.1 TetR family transcriptional regulator [Pelomonas sp. Root662]
MGRHRQFDVDQALDAALCVFWSKGYEGASYSDLTQAIGVERPALYAAFGNKEALFRQALDRYYERELAFFDAALELPTSREVAAHILHGAAEVTTRNPEQTGCLGIHGVLAGSDDAEPVRLSLIDARAEAEARLTKRLERARREGDLPASANSAVLASYLCAVTHGMAVQAKAGFSREKLDAIADQALSSWPRGEGSVSPSP